jgi:TonB family protein
VDAVAAADVGVDQVLAERERAGGSGPALASLLAAAVLHVAAAALVVVLPRLTPARPPLDYVTVQLVPAQRLGVEHPGQRAAPVPPPPPQPPRPQPAPPVEEKPLPPRSNDAPVLPRQQPPPAPARKPPKPEPRPKPQKPKPEPPDNRIDPTTLPKIIPSPRELLAQKLAQAAPPAPAAAPGPAGAATGAAAGQAPVGAANVSLENNDFTYNYYLAQLQSRIEGYWTRSPVGNGARAVISFSILSDGKITGVTVRESSGFEAYDLGALHAVEEAAPFPPLPRAYTISHNSLSVNWIAR